MILHSKTTDDSKRIHIIYIAVILTSCTLVISILLAVENIYILYGLYTNHRMVLDENTTSDSTVKRSKKISACFTIKDYIHKIIRSYLSILKYQSKQEPYTIVNSV
ncbi:unnamed protein product [Rotaria sordida]|uniref:Uncharacterized protein n=1 Tax=Rotaria sordida TaxID=392033 RepID=A0A815ZKX1_9BILA|nr:unnamed protein product [Rotaria sordida]CAF1586035.1 unnamed protein product [Rotaria sordida]